MIQFLRKKSVTVKQRFALVISYYQKSNLTLVGAVAFLMFIFLVGLYDTDQCNNDTNDCYSNTNDATRISSINYVPFVVFSICIAS